MLRPNYQQSVESGENFTQHGDVTVHTSNDAAVMRALDEIAAHRALLEQSLHLLEQTTERMSIKDEQLNKLIDYITGRHE